jgi:hypothetical protein
VPERLSGTDWRSRGGAACLALASLRADDAMVRSPSVFSETRVRPSFFRTAPAKKPRTECCCHPVTFMMAAIVVPCGRLNIAITLACLESARVRGGSVFPLFPGLAGAFADLRRLADAAGGFLAGSAEPDASSSTWMA